MGPLEIIAIIAGAIRLAGAGAELLAEMHAGGQTQPTPGQTARLAAANQAADDANGQWQAILASAIATQEGK